MSFSLVFIIFFRNEGTFIAFFIDSKKKLLFFLHFFSLTYIALFVVFS